MTGAGAPFGLDRLGLDSRLAGTTLALGAIWLGLDAATGGVFLTARNLYNLAVQTSVVGIMATGMSLVIVARHIDLSVGSVLGFAGMVVAALHVEGLFGGSPWPWPAAVAVGLALGGCIGAAQGYWIAVRGLPAFVVTLAGLLIFRGAAYLVTDGRTVPLANTVFLQLGGGIDGSIGAPASLALGALAAAAWLLRDWLAERDRRRHGFEARAAGLRIVRVGVGWLAIAAFVLVMNAHTQPRTGLARGIPIPVLALVAVAVLVTALSRVTRFGRYVFAIGGSPDAALRAGIDVRRVTVLLFSLMGMLAAFAGAVTVARLGAGASSMGTLTELAVIAAAVIGGTRLAGGVGSVPGAILGAVVMQSLENGMVLLGVSSAMRQIGIGGILIGAVWLDDWTGRRRGVS